MRNSSFIKIATATTLLIIISIQAIAQQYSRNSITPIFLVHKNGQLEYLRFADSVSIPDKYDYNYFGNNKMNVEFEMVSQSSKLVDQLSAEVANLLKSNSASSNQFSALNDQLEKAREKARLDDSLRLPTILGEFQQNKIANQILASILINPTLGYMTTELLSKRTMYNASDADYISAMNSNNQIGEITSQWKPLLKNTYVLVIDNHDISSENPEQSDNRCVRYTVSAQAYLLQIDIDSIIRTGQFDNLIFREKNQMKLTEFMNFSFPIKFILKTDISTSVDNFVVDKKSSGKSLLKAAASGGTVTDVIKYNIRSEDEVQADIANGLILSAEANITKVYEPFKVKTSVFSSRPITAKIGLKESLRADDLFKVTENVADKNGTVHERKVGWVRVKKVADNRRNADGKTRPSKFYKAYSRRIEKGMKLSQVSESGVVFGIGYNNGENLMGGPILNFDYISHISPGLRFGFGVGGFSTIKSSSVLIDNLPNEGWEFKGTNIYFELNAQKIFQANRIELIPYVGAYYSMLPITKFSIEGSEYNVSDYEGLKGLSNNSYGVLSGIKFGLNLGKHTQLNVGYKLGFEIGSILKSDNSEQITTDNGESINMTFDDPSALTMGIRLFGF